MLLRGIRFISEGAQRIGLGRESSCECGKVAYDGVEVLDGKIYFVGGKDGSVPKILLKGMIL